MSEIVGRLCQTPIRYPPSRRGGLQFGPNLEKTLRRNDGSNHEIRPTMQLMLRSFFLSAVLLPVSILADAKVWEPLTNDTLVGTWEAVMPIESTMVAGIYHME